MPPAKSNVRVWRKRRIRNVTVMMPTAVRQQKSSNEHKRPCSGVLIELTTGLARSRARVFLRPIANPSQISRSRTRRSVARSYFALSLTKRAVPGCLMVWTRGRKASGYLTFQGQSHSRLKTR